MSKTPIKVSYGQTFDEFIEITSYSDEMRFKTCMKLYKLFTTVEELEAVIDSKALQLIEDSI